MSEKLTWRALQFLWMGNCARFLTSFSVYLSELAALAGCCDLLTFGNFKWKTLEDRKIASHTTAICHLDGFPTSASHPTGSQRSSLLRRGLRHAMSISQCSNKLASIHPTLLSQGAPLADPCSLLGILESGRVSFLHPSTQKVRG